MSEIKCTCGRETCSGKIYFSDNVLWFTNDKLLVGGLPSELSIYVDANSLVKLIKESRKVLINMTNSKED